MPTITRTNLLWGLVCALALVVGLIAGRMGLVGQSPNTLSTANFRADFPLHQIREKTFKNETVELDGNSYVNCTFDTVTFKFEGQAPFGFVNSHFENLSKLQVVSNNPIIKSTLELVGALISLGKAGSETRPQQ
jgi:hypothetical protein